MAFAVENPDINPARGLLQETVCLLRLGEGVGKA